MGESDYVAGDKPGESKRPVYVAGQVLCTDPLVTISKTQLSSPGGLFSHLPEAIAGRNGIHLLGYNLSIEKPEFRSILVDRVAGLNRDFPGNHFVALANTEIEAYFFSVNGIPNLLANELIFVDERVFVPNRTDERSPVYNAIYNARFEPFKRHELAEGIESLLLIYDHLGTHHKEQYFDDMRQKLPRAVFYNHMAGGGDYRKLTHQEICMLINQARVGLCLSPYEGAMRASMEYALCGLPIVSTRSIGGRDRYFVGPHVQIVDDTADAVASGVDLLMKQEFGKSQIRNHVAHMLAFDRHNFIININKLVKSIHGIDDLFGSFEPFIGNPVKWRPLAEAMGPLQSPMSDI